MRRATKRCAIAVSILALAAILSPPEAAGQDGGGPPSAPVRFTPVVEHAVRTSIVLPGTVEARTVSLVASEVAGSVVALDAREGTGVRKGDVLARLATERLELDLEAQRGGLAEAEARFANADRRLGRARDLLESNHISPERFDDAMTEREAWQGRVRQFKGTIARIEHDIARCRIDAPFAGVVVSERTEVGEWIGVGDPVVEVLALDVAEVHVDVPERYFLRLSTGDPARVSFESLPGVSLDGEVAVLIPRADERARTFSVKVRISDPVELGAGMLAAVHLSAGAEATATLVPKDAIVAEGPRRLVFVIDDDETVRQVPLTVGNGVGAWVVVDGELTAGDRVITRGNERLRPGQRVQGELLAYELP